MRRTMFYMQQSAYRLSVGERFYIYRDGKGGRDMKIFRNHCFKW